MPEEILPEGVGSWHLQNIQSLVQMQVQSVCQKMVFVNELLKDYSLWSREDAW